MSDGVTQQALSRLSHLPGSTNPADMIAAQKYYDVEFTGGSIAGVALSDATLSNITYEDGINITQGTVNLSPSDGGNVIITPANNALVNIHPDENTGSVGIINNCAIGTSATASAAVTTLNASDVVQFETDSIVGTAAIATNATHGFLWVPVCAGAPSGNPTPPYSGAVALVYDSTDNKLYARVAGAWKSVALT